MLGYCRDVAAVVVDGDDKHLVHDLFERSKIAVGLGHRNLWLSGVHARQITDRATRGFQRDNGYVPELDGRRPSGITLRLLRAQPHELSVPVNEKFVVQSQAVRRQIAAEGMEMFRDQPAALGGVTVQ